MAKGEIARFVQFLLLSLCFQKPSAAEASESVYMREWVKQQFSFFRYNPIVIHEPENHGGPISLI